MDQQSRLAAVPTSTVEVGRFSQSVTRCTSGREVGSARDSTPNWASAAAASMAIKPMIISIRACMTDESSPFMSRYGDNFSPSMRQFHVPDNHRHVKNRSGLTRAVR